MSFKYQEIEKAVTILNLPERATLKQIKENYKKLIAKWHPDKCKKNLKKCLEMSQQITEAYKILLNYSENYAYSFKREDFEKEKSYEELWSKQFGDDPVWGKPKK